MNRSDNFSNPNPTARPFRPEARHDEQPKSKKLEDFATVQPWVLIKDVADRSAAQAVCFEAARSAQITALYKYNTRMLHPSDYKKEKKRKEKVAAQLRTDIRQLNKTGMSL